MDKIVFLDRPTLDANTFTTSEVIARYAGINRESVDRTIREQKTRLEHHGVLGFKIRKPPKGSSGGAPQKIYQLNEAQATLLITFLKNTDRVADFKDELVHQFYAMRSELMKRQTLREIEKPVRRSLTDAIQAWPYCNKWSYKAITDLSCKTVTGMSTKQYKAMKGVPKSVTGPDIYSADDLAHYRALESKVIVLLDLGFSYDQLKSAISGQPITVTLPAREAAQ